MAVELRRTDVLAFQWNRFQMNEIQLRARLATLACQAEEVFIISSESSFCVYAITCHIGFIIRFFRNMDIADHLRYFFNTEETLEHLIIDSCRWQANISAFSQFFSIAQETGTLGPGLRSIMNHLSAQSNFFLLHPANAEHHDYIHC